MSMVYSASGTSHSSVPFRVSILTKSPGLKDSLRSWVWWKMQNTRRKLQFCCWAELVPSAI